MNMAKATISQKTARLNFHCAPAPITLARESDEYVRRETGRDEKKIAPAMLKHVGREIH